MKIAAFSPAPWESACPTLRIVSPCEMAGLTLLRGTDGGWLDRTTDVSVVDAADVVVVQRDFARDAETFATVAARARALGKPLIYDLDDLLTDLPADHPEWEAYRSALWPIRWAVAAADAVTVSTPALRDALRELNPHIYLLPNYLDERLWQAAAASEGAAPPRAAGATAAPLTLGYMGTHTHALDLALAAPALRQIATRHGAAIRLEFVGGSSLPDELAELPNVVQDGRTEANYDRFAAWFAQRSWDIAIAPLRDTAFNRGKSNLKYLEYSVLGLPGVYSRVTPYVATVEEGAGILADTTEEWVAALDALIADGGRRRAMGEAARQKVRADWLLGSHVAEWPHVYRQILAVHADLRSRTYGAANVGRLRAWQQAEAEELARMEARAAHLENALAEQTRIAERQIGQLDDRIKGQEELIRWLEAELEKMRRSVTWRGTEPIRQAYARVQALQRARARQAEARAGELAATSEPGEEGQATSAPLVAVKPATLGPAARAWAARARGQFAAITAQALSPVTDVIICVGQEPRLVERCVAAVRRCTPVDAYRLHLVVHEDDLAGLSAAARADAHLHTHAMRHFNFARANNLALAYCPGDVVLLNDDTEATPGWLERLRADSRGVALTGARTGVECSGNPDTWGAGESRLTVFPINMFCAFVPQRVRAVVGELDETFAYYGGEDVDYSARALQHGFPLLVSSAFVHHAGAGSFRSRKQRLMEESEKILRERYGVAPPWELTRVGPLVSVILTTRGRAAQLAAVAESVLGGNYRAIELILVDDASADDTPAAIAALQGVDRRVIGVRLPERAGTAAARMHGAALARGQFLAFLDDTGPMEAGQILAALDYMLLHPELDVVYGGGSAAPTGGREPFASPDAVGAEPLLMRRRVLNDTPYLTHYEGALNLDWALRARRQGYAMGFVPGMSHAPRAAGADASALAQEEIRERERLMQQYGRQ